MFIVADMHTAPSSLVILEVQWWGMWLLSPSTKLVHSFLRLLTTVGVNHGSVTYIGSLVVQDFPAAPLPSFFSSFYTQRQEHQHNGVDLNAVLFL